MRILFFILLIFSSFKISAQSSMELIQQEIDKTVWTKFKQAFETSDSEILNSIYANDVLRVTPEGIDTENIFKIRNRERFKMLKENSASIRLDFWFDSRQTNFDSSYEVGFFKMTTSLKGESTIHYGQFHIVLKKIEGVWKIIQDWDTDTMQGKMIGQDEFQRIGTKKMY